MMKDSYSILVADDHPMFRRGITDLLNHEYIYRCTEAEDGDYAVHLATTSDYDLIIVDERMPRMHGFEAAKEILRIKPESKIIALSQYDDLSLILNFVKIGALGYLVKESDPAILIAAVRNVLGGHYYFNSHYADQLYIASRDKKNLPVPVIRFSKREFQIITLLCNGKTTAQIAKQLSLNFRTVETYRYDIIRKTGTSNSAQLIAYVYRTGLMK